MDQRNLCRPPETFGRRTFVPSSNGVRGEGNWMTWVGGCYKNKYRPLLVFGLLIWIFRMPTGCTSAHHCQTSRGPPEVRSLLSPCITFGSIMNITNVSRQWYSHGRYFVMKWVWFPYPHYHGSRGCIWRDLVEIFTTSVVYYKLYDTSRVTPFSQSVL